MTQPTTSIPVHCNCACVPRKFKGVAPVPACSAPAVDRNLLTLKGIVSGAHFSDLSAQDVRKRMFESKLEELELVEPLPWHSVITVADTWFWLQHGLLPDLWKENSLVMKAIDIESQFNNSSPLTRSIENRPGRLRMTNQMIGEFFR